MSYNRKQGDKRHSWRSREGGHAKVLRAEAEIVADAVKHDFVDWTEIVESVESEVSHG